MTGEIPQRARDGVSVVLVHTARRPVAVATLHALDAAVSGSERFDLCIVDLVGGDAPRPWAGRERVQVVGGAAGIGLAAARNRGAALARSPIILFLDAFAVPAPGFFEPAADALHADGSLAAVGFDVDGRGIPTITFDGRAATPKMSASNDLVPVLHPWVEAFAIRRAAFHETGGFDERYGHVGEEIDLGWRMWLVGHRVLFSPSSGVSLAAPPDVDPAEHRFLRDRNALCTIFKHYEPELLGRALPAALALTSARARLAQPSYEPTAADAVRAFSELLPELEVTRRQLAERRRRPDHEILPLFRRPLDFSDQDAVAAGELAGVLDSFRLREDFGSSRRIVVATPDVFTSKMAGPAIRAWHIASALATDHEVQLVTTSSLCEIHSHAFVVRTADDEEFAALEEWCDVIILQGFVMEGRPFLRETDKVMVVDIYDPLHLEQLELTRDDGDAHRRFSVRNSTRVLNEQLLRGDFFVCASPKQRDFWLGQLSGVGRVNPLTYDEDETLGSLLAVVPFGLPDAPPMHTRRALKGVFPGIGEDDEVILWGGGIYNWFDPLTLVRAVEVLRHRRPRVRLFFMGLKHPNPDVEEMRMARETRELSARLGLTDVHVFFNDDWVAYDDRQNYLLEADVGVSCHLDHVETAFSFRTRILDYIWAGLPIVGTSGDAFADLIEAEEVGVTVPAGDVDRLEEALFRVLDDRAFAATCRANLAGVRGRFAWSEVLRPLVDFCAAPRRAPDLVDPEMAQALSLPASTSAAVGGVHGPTRSRLRPRRAEVERVLSTARARLARGTSAAD